MHGPEQAAEMVYPVFKIKSKVFQEKKQYPVEVGIFNNKKMMRETPA
jgi:hypothetical protein